MEGINGCLNCLHGYNKRKAASETDTFGWMLSVVPLVRSDCMIFWSIFWKGEGSIWDYLFWLGVASSASCQSDCRILRPLKWYLRVFLYGVSHQWKGASETKHYVWLDLASCASCQSVCVCLGFCIGMFFSVICCILHPIRLKDPFISKKTGSNQLIFLVSCMGIIIKGRWHLRLPLLVGCVWVYLLANQIPGLFDDHISERNQVIPLPVRF